MRAEQVARAEMRKAEIAEQKALYTYTFFLEGYPCPHPYRKAPY